jgi:hypothetical protein
MEPKTGDRVHIEFDGTVESGCVNVKDSDGIGAYGMVAVHRITSDDGCIHFVYLGEPGIWEAAEPDDWPPREGDIWKAGGHEYFARQHSSCKGQLTMVGDHGTLYYGNDVPRFKALNPNLVRRRP